MKIFPVCHNASSHHEPVTLALAFALSVTLCHFCLLAFSIYKYTCIQCNHLIHNKFVSYHVESSRIRSRCHEEFYVRAYNSFLFICYRIKVNTVFMRLRLVKSKILSCSRDIPISVFILSLSLILSLYLFFFFTLIFAIISSDLFLCVCQKNTLNLTH